MIYLSRNNADVDFQKYEENLSAAGAEVFIDYARFTDILDEVTAKLTTAKINCSDRIRMISNGKYAKTTPQQLTATLIEFCDIDKKDLYSHKTRGPSADQEILGVLRLKLDLEKQRNVMSYLHQQAAKILEEYAIVTALRSSAGTERKLQLMSNAGNIGWGGAELAKIGFVYEQRATARYYTMQDNIQGWNGDFLQSLTVPNGWYLWWGDFDQIDLRVFMNSLLMQGDPELKEIMNSCPDKYEAFTRYMYKSLKKNFDLEYFTKNRQRFKAGILSVLYGITENSLARKLDGDAELAHMLIEFLTHNKAYIQFRENIENAIRLGLGVTLEDYFGVTRTIETQGDIPNTRNMNQALNIPNQCGSNSVVVQWVNHVMNEFEKHGLKRDMVQVYLMRHDEVIIALRKEALQYAWILKNACTIQVDDWDVLSMGYQMGLYYTEEMPELTQKFEEICERNKDKIVSVEKGLHIPYKPIHATVKGYMYSNMTPNQFCVMAGLPEPPDGTLQSALQYISDAAGRSSGNTRRMCSNYVRYFGVVSYYSPTLQDWKYRRPLAELLQEENVYGAIIYNATGNSFDYVENLPLRYTVMPEGELVDLLDKSRPLDYEQIEREHEAKKKSGYRKHIFQQDDSITIEYDDGSNSDLDLSFGGVESGLPWEEDDE